FCELCGGISRTTSSAIGVCSRCLRNYGEKSLEIARRAHRSYRESLGLPLAVPKQEGTTCRICVNECSISEDSPGFCGFWIKKNGVLNPITSDPSVGLVLWYYDPHPTNCVAGPVCPANTSRGYPHYTRFRGVEVGYYNLAVFYIACNLNCLFCQNWEHKTILSEDRLRARYRKTVDELVKEALNRRVTCVCYFGGDPTPQIAHALAASRKILAKKDPGEVKRICWETNGLENPVIMKQMAELSLVSGGIVKIDWKAWSPEIYEALTGVDGRKAVERLKTNVKLVADLAKERGEPPPLVVSTLLVPGYVDEYEVSRIAEYVASVDSKTPLVLLAFHPDNVLRDLPPTSKKHAEAARREALRAGLREVYVGNVWLLGNYY
ncbi:MAG: radical SAM protein, partial [Sulfolobales archaeon]|nr:radical SAM protein [Sulfolobales archaeon]